MDKLEIKPREAQRLSKEGLFAQFSKLGVKFDSVKEPNPDSIGNGSRDGFLYSYLYHPLGKFFQEKIKSSILTAISTFYGECNYNFSGDYLKLQKALYEAIRAHVTDDKDRKQAFLFQVADILVYAVYNNSVLSKLHHNRFIRSSIDFEYVGILKYDKEAFIYDDVRLSSLSSLLTTEIKDFRNDETLLKIIDICIFLMKEDIYYRPRWILILQEIRPIVDDLNITNNKIFEILKKTCDLAKDMELTENESQNIKEWH